MTEVINLRQKRKEKSRSEKDKQAAANRAKFGRTKAEKKVTELNHKLTERKLEGHKLQADEEE